MITEENMKSPNVTGFWKTDPNRTLLKIEIFRLIRALYNTLANSKILER